MVFGSTRFLLKFLFCIPCFVPSVLLSEQSVQFVADENS